MTAEKKDKFDAMLREGLKLHRETTPADFTERILMQVRKAEQQRILSRVILQKRLALAAGIVLGVGVVIAAGAFPQAAGEATRQLTAFWGSVKRSAVGISYQWQLYAAFAGLFGYAAYNLWDMLIRES
jgi:hypothetical protein